MKKAISSDGTEIEYAQRGDGPALILWMARFASVLSDRCRNRPNCLHRTSFLGNKDYWSGVLNDPNAIRSTSVSMILRPTTASCKSRTIVSTSGTSAMIHFTNCRAAQTFRVRVHFTGSLFMIAPKAARFATMIILLGIVFAVLIPWVFPCMMVDGGMYRSNQEVDDFVGGMMYPQVSFRDGTFTWLVTDMLFAGTYECKSGSIIAYPYSISDPLIIQLYPGATALILKGQIYIRVLR